MKLIKQKRLGQLVGLGISLVCIMLTAVHAQHLTALDVVTPSDVETELHYRFDKNVQAPKSFYLKDKGLVVVDFISTGVDQTLDNKIIDNNVIADVQNLYSSDKNRVRSIIKVKPNIAYTIHHKDDEVVVTFSRNDSHLSDDRSIVDNLDKPPLETKEVKFYRNSQGAGVIEVFLPDDQTQAQVTDQQNKGVVLSMPSMSWNANQVRRIDVTDFATPVSALEVVNKNGISEVRVRTQADYEFSSQQIGSKYQLIIKPKIKSLDINSRREGLTPVESTGDLMSLNLEDVDVRAILKIIADIKGLNIEVSDSVNSRITIRLQNVPWDRALDVVLRSKGLRQQRSGTTIYIVPGGDCVLESTRDLITEVFEIKHAKASEIATVLQTSNKSSSESSHQPKGLSQYGQLAVDSDQNLLIVRDTLEQMEIIKALISELDKPPLEIKDVEFYRNSQGAGVIEVFLPDDQTQVQVVDKKREGVVLSMPGMSWDAKQVRRIEVTGFATPVSALEVANNNGISEVRVRTQADYEYSSQQIGNKYQLIIKPKIKPLYTGDLISLDFKDIDVRAVLQIIADFTGLNIVVSDSVNSRITIRLKDVPWDQALDVVLRSKGLVQQRSGPTIYIIPREEISCGGQRDSMTEVFEINHAKASDIAAILRTSYKNSLENSHQSKGLSKYGELTVDPDQNLLIVRDTLEQMEIIKALISQLDKPPLETKDIEFYRNSQGAGVIEVFLPDDQTQVQVIDQNNRGVVLSMSSMNWDAKQVRRVEVTDFATPVSALEVVNNNGTAEVRVRTQAHYEYSSQQIGNKYQLIIKPKTKPLDMNSRKRSLTPAEYTGDLISLNFKDIDVRAVLQIIADFTGQNIVVSDSVNDRITIRVQNVSWDQALDVVLRSKGLVKQRRGTIIYIVPRGDCALESTRELITEVLELKHAKASDIANVLQTSNKNSSENSHQSKGLSQYGELAVDPNQNLLIVRDTPEQMEIIKGLISELDNLPLKTKDVEFYRNSKGAGVIEVFLPDDQTQVQVIDQKNRGVVLSMPSMRWDAKQVRRIEVTDYATPVSALDVVNNNGIAEVRVRTQANYEYSVQQIGNKYQLIIKPKIRLLDMTKITRCGGYDKYTGEVISIDFKDVDVRVIFKIIADFTGLNIVVSDSTNSRITIRLQNVPWDQALDVVLRSKGLVQQKSGSTIYIVPGGGAIAADQRELIIEEFELKHAKASEIAAVLQTSNKSSSENNHQSKGLSQYGELIVDPNQNLLIVRDTVEQMEIIKALIDELDNPFEIKDIEFFRNSQGAGVIEVFLPDNQTQVQVVDNQKKGIVLSMPSMSWDAKQVRRIEVTDYATPVSALEVVNNQGIAEVRVRTQANYEYSSQQIGNKYQLIINR